MDGRVSGRFASVIAAFGLTVAGLTAALPAWANGAAGAGDLTPLPAESWHEGHAAHLLERAGFGGTPEEVERLAALGLEGAVRRLVYFDGVPDEAVMPEFDHSGVFDPGLDPFPPSRPATTEAARANGEALGIRVKSGGNRPIQPVVNAFFYWLRASRLETDRVAQWWAGRMLTTQRPLQKRRRCSGTATSPRTRTRSATTGRCSGRSNCSRRMDSAASTRCWSPSRRTRRCSPSSTRGINVKGSPNENFAREIMELFTMGPGNYTETDIREGARAFTGWNFRGTEFAFNAEDHDEGEKSFLGRTGPLDGEDVIAVILEQDATARFVAARLYRYFVRDALDPALADELGTRLRELDFEIAPFLAMLLSSRDFYSPASVATRIKSPVELVVSTYRKLGLGELPGVPDFNVASGVLGSTCCIRRRSPAGPTAGAG